MKVTRRITSHLYYPEAEKKKEDTTLLSAISQAATEYLRTSAGQLAADVIMPTPFISQFEYQWQEGDQIQVKVDGEKRTATAVFRNGLENRTLFVFDRCLCRMPMYENPPSGTLDYQSSDVHQYLQEMSLTIPWKWRKRMLEQNGDLLFLLSKKSVCGAEDDPDAQLPWFKDPLHRITNVPGEDYSASWWLRDVVSGTNFAYVGTTGFASYGGASGSLGVRPAFWLLDL